MSPRTDLDVERKKALAFLAGDTHISLEARREAVPPVKEKNEGENERKKVKKVVEEVNPRLRTEAYLKKIGKL